MSNYADKLKLSEKDMGRFVSKFILPENPNDCWEWVASKNKKGYGQFRVRGILNIATRVMYYNFVGSIRSTNEQVCHKCDNPKCVNPTHLFLGSNTDNQIDSIRKGRNFRLNLTHCPSNHEYTPENTYVKPNGWRICRKCQLIRQRKRDKIKREERRKANG